jgi:16S rRNA pseudouridine516 synthase
MRLDKALADMGVATRSELKKLARNRRIKVNGEVVRDPAMQVNPETDELSLDDEVIVYQKYVYFLLNKPAGLISASTGAGTVMELFDEPYKGLFPCGRLDRDTTGLLLVTNDGQLAHELLSPKKHVDKEYEVTLRDPISEDDITAFKEGIMIDGDEQCLPSECTITTQNTCHMILHEGKYHQVKRMFLARGNEVTALKRIRMKNLMLDESLAPGKYRELSEAELDDLRSPV